MKKLRLKKTKPKPKQKNRKQPNKTARSNVGLVDYFMSMFRFNIRFKFTIGYAIQILFLVIVMAVTIYYGACQYVWRTQLSSFHNNSENLELLINTGYNYSSETIKDITDNLGLEILVYNTEFEQLYSYPGSKTEEFDLSRFDNSYQWWTGHRFPNLYKKISIENNSEATIFIVLKKMLHHQIDLFNILMPPVIILLFILYFGAVKSASKMAQRYLEPIHTMTSQVRKISAQNLSTRLDIRGTKDELKDLAHTFNQMLDGISRSYEREKQFVSDASHELRTPIAVIKGYAALVQRWGKNDPEVLNESIQAIVSEADSMQSLVESLLFIARKDRGTLKMELQDFNISDLVSEIVRDTKLIDKNHRILDDIAKNLTQYGSADKLKQAFRILVDNSIKYTPDRGIIQIDLKSSDKHNIFMICDTGIGISKEDLPHIFDRFYRADKSRTRYNEKESGGGTGLGLSIAKIIIEQHGGRVIVESEINIGTKFAVFLPKKADSFYSQQ